MNNEKIYETLEFDKVLQAVQIFAQTELAKHLIAKMRPSSDRERLEQWQAETEQSLSILNQKKSS